MKTPEEMRVEEEEYCDQLWERVKQQANNGRDPRVQAGAITRLAARCWAFLNVPSRAILEAFRDALDEEKFEALGRKDVVLRAAQEELADVREQLRLFQESATFNK